MLCPLKSKPICKEESTQIIKINLKKIEAKIKYT